MPLQSAAALQGAAVRVLFALWSSVALQGAAFRVQLSKSLELGAAGCRCRVLLQGVAVSAIGCWCRCRVLVSEGCLGKKNIQVLPTFFFAIGVYAGVFFFQRFESLETAG